MILLYSVLLLLLVPGAESYNDIMLYYVLYYVLYYIILGAEIIFNSSGSHHELRKLHKRIKLISDSMNKVS